MAAFVPGGIERSVVGQLSRRRRTGTKSSFFNGLLENAGVERRRRCRKLGGSTVDWALRSNAGCETTPKAQSRDETERAA